MSTDLAPPSAIGDLLQVAAELLQLGDCTREMLRGELAREAEQAQRAALAAVARGMVSAEQALAVPPSAISGPARSLAWLSACSALEVFGPGCSFFAARYALATTPRLEMPLNAWMKLLAGAELELDLAESAPCGAWSVRKLLRGEHARAAACFDELLPVMEAMHEGRPLRDTAARLRRAADVFEGRAAARTHARRAA